MRTRTGFPTQKPQRTSPPLLRLEFLTHLRAELLEFLPDLGPELVEPLPQLIAGRLGH
jgi:hypothetical protein